ncbi:MAG TPA: Bax inhibitor-1/YccA family protein [Candidatus Saccharimonadales bacterium]|nr:Bax inhibitor-1/YccA family protein [Candidatus Saccharimonadales bacterium]
MNYNNQGHYGLMAQGFMAKVYGWMCAGLAVTAAVSYYLSPEVNPELMRSLISNFGVMLGLLFVSIGILIYMQWNFARLSYTTMGALFIVFCALQGIALAPISYKYTQASIFYVFLIAVIMFAVMAIYGWVTNADLSSMGNLLFMGLIGLIVANLISIFVRSAAFNMVIASFGVGIFAMLIAYDVQNLKRLSQNVLASPQDAGKFALMGAIGLYLNLLNIFIYLLRLFGKERD